MDPEICLKVSDLTKDFRLHYRDLDIPGCKNISFQVRQGEFLGITGPSGSGKSTILKLIYRTYRPQGGTIFYRSGLWGAVEIGGLPDRQVMALRRRELGYVSQFLNVIPRTSARELVEQSLSEIGCPREEAPDRATDMLLRFNLPTHLHDSWPSTFSGGEKLRLNIARAMVKSPRLLLLDEPTASLDNQSKARVRDVLEQLKSEGTTILGIFHDLEFMEGLCDREFPMVRLGVAKL